MASRELPDYLRPVPGPEATAAAPDRPPPTGPPGLTPPRQRGHSGSFVTDVIVELGFASREQIDEAIEAARTSGQTPEEILLNRNVIDAERLAQATAERYGLDYVDLAVYQVDTGAANLISVKTARRYQVVPIAFVDEQTLLLAMADPANVLALDDVQMATGLSCRVAVASVGDIEALVGKLSTLESTVASAVEEERRRRPRSPSRSRRSRISAPAPTTRP